LNLSVFKYPIGFVRILELVFIIIALATVNSWHVKLTYKCPAAPNDTQVTLSAEVDTFTLTKARIPDCKNETSALWEKGGDNSTKSAGFFYFTNIFALIFVLAITFVYVVLWEMYDANKRLSLIDLAITALLFVFWFICASVWWSGSSNMGDATDHDHIVDLMTNTPGFWKEATTEAKDDLAKSLTKHANTGSLVISVLCNWVCVMLFAGNCWFVYKEVAPRKDVPATGIY